MSGSGLAPPPFVRMAAHDLRWRLLCELAGGDYRVRELVQLVGHPQNLVSYHLRLLRDADLVSSRRSSFDARDTYYHLDLDRCASLLAATGPALHPALRGGTPTPAAPPRRPRPRVLFACTGNSARSPMAEALLRHHCDGAVEVSSAGSHPRERIHPVAVRVLAVAYGIDISEQRPRRLDPAARRRFDYVVTLCDKVKEICPEFPGSPPAAHWSMPDPAAEGDGHDASYPAFCRTADELDVRIALLIGELTAQTSERRHHVR